MGALGPVLERGRGGCSKRVLKMVNFGGILGAYSVLISLR